MCVDKQRTRNINIFLLIPIFLCAVCTFSKWTFNIYDSLSLYIILFFTGFTMFVNRKILRSYLIFILFLVLYLPISVFFNNGGLGSVITLISTIFMIYMYSHITLTDRTCRFLVILSTVAIVYLFIRSFGYALDFYYYKSYYLNPNTVGMCLIYFYMIRSIVNQSKSKMHKIETLLLFVLVVIGVQNCSSRGSLLALLFFVVLNLVPKRVITRKNVILISIIIISLGILFPFVYLGLYRNNVQFELFGKSIYTGRETIWNNMFELLDQSSLNWLFGIGSDEVLMSGKELNVHNDYFSVIVNYGLIGLISYYGFVLAIIVKASKYVQNSRFAKVSIIAFITSVLLLGFFEVTTLWSAMYPLSLFSIGTLYGRCVVHGNGLERNKEE